MKQTYSSAIKRRQLVTTDRGNMLISKAAGHIVLCTGSGHGVIIGGAGAIIGTVLENLDPEHYLPFYGSVTLHNN